MRRDGRRERAVRRALVLLVMALVAVAAAGCAAGTNPQVDAGQDPAGFWLGLWHGFITPVTFVVSLFRDDVNVYEVANNGNWYDFGFVLGLSMIFSGGGGGAAARRR